MKQNLYTIQEVSSLLGVSPKTLRRWEEAGLIKPIRTVGNQRRYRLEDVKKLERRRQLHKMKKEVRSEVPQTPVTVQQVKQAATETAVIPSFSPAAQITPRNDAEAFRPVLTHVAPSPADAAPVEKLPTTAQKENNSFLRRMKVPFWGAVSSLLLLLVSAIVWQSAGYPGLYPANGSQKAGSMQKVLGESTSTPLYELAVNVPSFFGKPVTFLNGVQIKNGLNGTGLALLSGGIDTHNADINAGKGKLTASNVIYSLLAGSNITISGDKQNPTISASASGGVTSLQGSTGAVNLTSGSGISLNGLQVSNTGVLSLGGATGAVSLTAGSGISVSGTTITNSDAGSAQDIFKNFTIGATTLAAGSNNDTITFAAGSGIVLTGNATNKTITITSNASGTLSGLTTDGVLYATSNSNATSTSVGPAGTVLHGTGGVPSFSAVSLTADVTGILPTANGGTGISTTPSAGQVLIGNGSGYQLGTLTAGSGIGVANGSGTITLTNSGVLSLTGTASQVLVNNTSGTAQTGAITLTLPQNIATGSTPSFASLTLSSSTNQLTLGSGNTGIITTATLTSGRTYTLPDSSGTVCLTTTGCGGGSGVSGSGTAGQIAFFTGASAISSETTGFAWDSTNKRFGIGTDTPPSKLSVFGAVVGQALGIFNETGDQSPLAASASGTAIFAINHNGDLQFTGGSSFMQTLTSTAGSGKTYNFPTFTGSSADICLNTGNCSGIGGIIGGSGSLDYIPKFTPDGSHIGDSLLYDNGTSVGLNTTSPVGLFDVNGAVAGQALAVFNYTGTDQNILVGSVSGAMKFAFDASGNLNLNSGSYEIGGTSVLNGTTLGNGITVSNLSQVGTITSGAWHATAIGTQYGGTGNDWSAVAQGSIPYFSGVGAMSTFGPGTSGQILQSNGAGSAPSWITASGTLNFWQLANGALSPLNISNDLLLGGSSTSSAKFAFINNAGGTPTASISGNLSLAVPTGANPAAAFNILNGGTLGYYTSPGGDAGLSANPALYIANNGYIGVNKTSPTTYLDIQAASTNTAPINLTTTTNLSGDSSYIQYNNRAMIGYEGDIASAVVRGESGKGVALEVNGAVTSIPFYIDQNQHVLIGQNAVMNEITNGVQATANLTVGGDASVAGQMVFYSTPTIQSMNKQTLKLGGNLTGDIQFLPGNASSSLYLASSGNVGIGTSNPLKGLQVQEGGTSGLTSAYGNGLLFSTNSNAGARIFLEGLNNPSGQRAVALVNETVGLDGTTYFGSLTDDGANWLHNYILAFDNATGNVGIGTGLPTAPLQVNGTYGSNAAAIINQQNSGDIIDASASGTTKFVINNNGNIQFTGGTSYLNTISTTGAFSGAQQYNFPNQGGTICLSTNNCGFASGTNYWQENQGSLSPLNVSDDLLLGATSTSSAKFAFENVAGGTPTASVSANSGNNATYLTGAGVLGTTNMQTLQLGNSSTGNVVVGNNTGLYLTGTSAYISNPQGQSGSEAFGLDASVTSSSETAVGYYAQASNFYGTAIGANTQVTSGGVALGYSSTATNGVSIGWNSTSGDNGINIGGGAGGAPNSIGIGSAVFNQYSIELGNGITTDTASNQFIVGTNYNAAGSTYINDAYIGSGVTDASPQSVTINATGGSGTNIAGANLTLAGGKGTGNAAGGYISFATSLAGASGSTLQSLTERMRITDAGNVGIGTTSPVAPLQVSGSYGGNAAAIVNQLNSGNIFSASSSGTTKFTLTNNGDIMLGNFDASTSATLSNNGGGFLVASDTVEADFGMAGNAYYSGGWKYRRSGTDAFDLNLNGDAGYTDLTVAPSGPAGSAISWNQAMAINDSTGSVGIGKTYSPSDTLDVVGNSGTTFNTYITGNTAKASLAVNNTGSGDLFTASASGATKFVITSAGDVGIGTTTPVSSLEVANSTNASTGFTIAGSGGQTLQTYYNSSAGNFWTNVSTGLWALNANNGNGIDVGANSSFGGADATFSVFGTTSLLRNADSASAFTINSNLHTTNTTMLDVSTMGTDAVLKLNQIGSGDLFTASSSGTPKFTITNAGGLQLGSSQGTNGQCLTSGGTGGAAGWSNCSAGNFWTLNNGLLYNGNTTTDFAIGGTSSSSAQFALTNLNGAGAIGKFSTATNHTPTPTWGSGVIAVNGYMYVMGGFNNVSTGNAIANVYFASINSDGSVGQFVPTTSLPVALGDVQNSVAYMNGYIYFVEGSTTSTEQSTVYYAKVNANGTLGSWQTANSLSQVEAYTDVTAANGYLYAMSGDINGTKQVNYAKQNPDGSLGPWATTTNLDQQRSAAGTFAANGFIYVVGGQNTGNDQTTTAYAKQNSDGTLGSWIITSGSSNLPTAMSNAATFVSNGYVYVMAGDKNGTAGNEVYYAKLNNNGSIGAWATSPITVPATLYSPGYALYNGYMYVVNGQVTEGTASSNSSTVYYTSAARMSFAGNIDLLGPDNTNLASASGTMGGSVYAGNIFANNSLEVRGAASLWSGLTVNGNENVAGNLFLSGINGTTPIASISGNTAIAGMVIDNSGSGDLFTASKSGATKFVITNAGNITASNYAGSNAVLYAAPTTGLFTAATTVTSNQCLLSGASTPSWGACSTGTNQWQRVANGTSSYTFISPNTISDSLSVGVIGSGAVLPYSTLYVQPSANTKGQAMVAFNQTGSGPIFTASSSGTTEFVIDNAGNVGIGETTPTARLDVTGISGTSTSVNAPLGLNILGGNGYSYGAGGGTGGSGGGINLTAGNGGRAGNLSGNGGQGGTVSIFAGNGNSASNGIDGNGGDIVLIAGSGGGGFQNGNGGNLYLAGGAMGTGGSGGANGNVILGRTNSGVNQGYVAIGTTSPLATFDVRANSGILPIASISGSTAFAGLVVDNSGTGDLFTASASGTSKFTITNAGGLQLGSSQGTNGQCLTSGGTGGAAGWANCSSSNPWTLNNGLLYAGNTTTDFAIGGTSTASAQFSLTNLVSPGAISNFKTNANSSPTAVYANSVVVANGYIYIIGGSNNAATPVANVYYASINSDGSTGKFIPTASLPVGTTGISNSVTYLNGYIYVVDGNTSTGMVSTVYFTKVNDDGTLAGWQKTTSTNNGNQAAIDVTSANGYVYAISGENTVNTTMVEYAKQNPNGTLGAWNTTTSIDQQRYAAGIFIANGYIYVVGGENASNLPIASTAYAKLNSDGTVGSWTVTAGSSNMPTAVGLGTSFVSNGYIYEIAGDNNGTTGQEVYYAPLNNDGSIGSWATSPVILPTALYQSGYAMYNGYMYLIGGDPTEGGPAATTNVYYTSAARMSYAGNIDLLGPDNTNFASASGTQGGGVYAGNLFAQDSLEVHGTASLWSGLNVNGPTVATGGALFGDIQSATAAATIQNTAANGGTLASCGDNCHAGLNIQLGTIGSNTLTNTGDLFINFMNGAGRRMGYINGTNGSGVNYVTKGADYAEYFAVDPNVLPANYTEVDKANKFPTGTLVCQDSNGVAPCSAANNQGILGVISEHPGFTGGEDGPNKVLVGLVGQLPVRVSTQNGSIKNGDPLAASSIPGVAVKAINAGEIIGRAEEDYTASDAAAVGTIQGSVHATWYDPGVYLTDTGNVSIFQKTPGIGNTSQLPVYGVTDQNGGTVQRVGVFSDAAVGNLKAGGITAQSINTQDLLLAGQSVSDRLNTLENAASNSAQLGSKVASLSNSLASLQDRVASLEGTLNLLASGSALLNNIFTASSASQLGLDKLTANDAVLNNSLTVLGKTTVADLGVTGRVTIGLLGIDGLDQNNGAGQAFASINTSAGPLMIQSEGLNGVDFLNGKLTINTKGDLQSQGEITAVKYNVDTGDVAGASLGTATLPAGYTSVVINTTAVSSQSAIFVTPKTKTSEPLSVTQQSSGKSFKVEVTAPAAGDIKFNWWIVN